MLVQSSQLSVFWVGKEGGNIFTAVTVVIITIFTKTTFSAAFASFGYTVIPHLGRCPEPVKSFWVRMSRQTNMDDIIVWVLRQLEEGLHFQVLMGDFSHPSVSAGEKTQQETSSPGCFWSASVTPF